MRLKNSMCRNDRVLGDCQLNLSPEKSASRERVTPGVITNESTHSFRVEVCSEARPLWNAYLCKQQGHPLWPASEEQR